MERKGVSGCKMFGDFFINVTAYVMRYLLLIFQILNRDFFSKCKKNAILTFLWVFFHNFFIPFIFKLYSHIHHATQKRTKKGKKN